MFARTLLKTTTRTLPTLRLSTVRYQSTIQKINPESLISKYSQGPINLRFTEDHEYIVAHPDNTGFIGITKYASDAIGDVTYVELPEVGDEVEAGDIIGSIESVKSSNDIFAPISGQVVQINEALNDNPPLVNSDPLGEGWIVQIKFENTEELNKLKDEAAYEEFLESE